MCGSPPFFFRVCASLKMSKTMNNDKLSASADRQECDCCCDCMFVHVDILQVGLHAQRPSLPVVAQTESYWRLLGFPHLPPENKTHKTPSMFCSVSHHTLLNSFLLLFIWNFDLIDHATTKFCALNWKTFILGASTPYRIEKKTVRV